MNRMDIDYFKETRSLEELLKHDTILLYGIGNQCKDCYLFFKKFNINVILFDSNPEKWGKVYQQNTIYSPTEIPKYLDENAVIVISSIYNQYEIAVHLFNNYGISKNQLFCYISQSYYENVLDNKKLLEKKSEIYNIIEKLEDEESKNYYINSLKMRLQKNPLFIKPNINCRVLGEYGDIIQIKKGDSIIDCGAYTGDTAEIYYERMKGDCTVYAIEPFASSFEKLVNRIDEKGYNNKIFPYNYAVSNMKREATIMYNSDDFAMTMNINNRIKGMELQTIYTSTLDMLFSEVEKIDYIKMDIEGEEANALMGAKEILKRNKPKLMISAYHKIEDFWVIPQIIKEINPEYKIYVGHAPGVSMEMEYYCI